ncbi:MAG TPA: GNAT family N-acetyltransferase [Chloroflexota bacterium]
MDDSLQIRQAEPDDAEVASVLLYSAYTHTLVPYPLPEADERGWIDRLQHYICQDGNRFSYQNIQVAAHNSTMVGLVLSFGGQDEARINAAVGRWLEREAADDEWYIDALAVLEPWTRRGIGAHLLDIAEQQAHEHHYLKIALHVATGNIPAMTLYTHRHYVVTEQTVLYGTPYVRMVKILKNSA